MTTRILIVLVTLLGWLSVANGDSSAFIELQKFKADVHNKASVVRGAKYFAQNCMVCHTMKYITHNKIAKAAGITLDKMPLKKKDWWFGAVPPDLTLAARQYSPAWIYTFLHAFYKDPSRSLGYNNLLKPNISMPNQFVAAQGEQILTEEGKQLIKEAKLPWQKLPYFAVLKLVKRGSMTPAEFDDTMRDLVNFLTYAADPQRAQREWIGAGVLVFLFILLILAVLLKKAYWKDIPKD